MPVRRERVPANECKKRGGGRWRAEVGAIHPKLLRMVQRFLKAGILEDGVFTASEEGTPQGGRVSPVLSNIYLHYGLDLWFEKRFAKECTGKAYLIRFADGTPVQA